MANISGLPRLDIPEIEKTPAWCAKVLTYGEYLLRNIDAKKSKYTRLWRVYNGVKTAQENQYWQKTYGKDNKAKYIAYRAMRTKINTLHGEWLKRPLSATVETTNLEAMNDKMRHLDFMKGAMIAQEPIGKMKEFGVDVMQGVPIPKNEDDPIWEKMSPKDKCEDIMQILLNDGIKEDHLIQKFGENFLSATITSGCFGKIEIDEQGNDSYHPIDLRNAIYEEVEGDYFLQKSTVKGCRQMLPLHMVLERFAFTEDERNKLNDFQRYPERWKGSRYFEMDGQQLLVEVIHLEWFASKPSYYKIAPKTKSQLDYNDDEKEVMIPILAEKYEKNKAVYDREVAKGLYTIVSKWDKDLWEGTRIAGIIDKNMRRKKFQMRSHDYPSNLLDCSYVGCLIGTADGMRISIQETGENLDNLYDIVQFQKMKSLAMFKGKMLGFDLSALPKHHDLKSLLYDMINDGIVSYDTSAAGSFAGKQLDLKNMMQEVDLGLSESFGQLLTLEENILNMMDRITGINENREGQIAASATVTNSQQALENSRTQTTALYSMMNLFVEHTLLRIVETKKVCWGLYKVEKGEQILGSSKFKYLQMTSKDEKDNVAYRDYGVHIQDGGKYNEIKQRIMSLAEASLNAKEIRFADVLKLEMAETFVEAKTICETAWLEIQKVQQDQARMEQESRAQQQQQQLDTQIKINNDNMEHAKQIKIEEIAAKGETQVHVNREKAKDKLINDSHKAEFDLMKEE